MKPEEQHGGCRNANEGLGQARRQSSAELRVKITKRSRNYRPKSASRSKRSGRSTSSRWPGQTPQPQPADPDSRADAGAIAVVTSQLERDHAAGSAPPATARLGAAPGQPFGYEALLHCRRSCSCCTAGCSSFGRARLLAAALARHAAPDLAICSSICAVYFIYCWTHSGQTLPMKTWRIRLVTHEGNGAVDWPAPPSKRYVLALAGIRRLPAAATARALGRSRRPASA